MDFRLQPAGVIARPLAHVLLSKLLHGHCSSARPGRHRRVVEIDQTVIEQEFTVVAALGHVGNGGWSKVVRHVYSPCTVLRAGALQSTATPSTDDSTEAANTAILATAKSPAPRSQYLPLRCCRP